MPLYDGQCEKCKQINEYWATFSTVHAGSECACGGHMSYVPSFGRSADAQRFSPVVIHRDAQGNIRFPGSSDAPVPTGFEKVELNTLPAIRAFEREVNQRDQVQAQEFNYRQRQFREGQLAENRRAVEEIRRGGSWQGLDENGKLTTLHGMSERGQQFYEAMRKVSEDRSRSSHRAVDPAFYIEAFSQNASNREDHRDAKGDWNRVRK